MKRFASISAVVVLLLATAIYYGSQNRPVKPSPKPDPPIVPDVTKHTPPLPDVTAKTTDSAGDTLKIAAATSHGFVKLAGGQEVYATIDIEAIKHDSGKRSPLNLAIVIDRSGSMSGAKIERVKDAARRLVNQLRPQDRLTIVSYGSDVTVDFSAQFVTATARAQILSAINGIEVSGGTNLSGGWQRGYEQISRWKTPESVNRVLLMSDGNANIGTTYLPDLKRMSREALTSGVSLTTMGVGLDYNEDLMAAMANEGAGNYHFIDEKTDMFAVFDKELKSLSGTVAKNTSLVVTLPKGVQLKQLYGFPHRKVDGKILVPLAEFASAQKKSILMKLAVAPSAQGAQDVFEASLSYNDLVRDNATALHTVRVNTVATEDANKLTAQINTDVISRVQQIEVATSMQKAMDLYAEGKKDEAERTITATQQRMRERRKTYTFKPSAAKSYDRVDNELHQLNDTFRNVSSGSAEGRRMVKAKKARGNAILFDSTSF